jgi:hypothetical protein
MKRIESEREGEREQGRETPSVAVVVRDSGAATATGAVEGAEVVPRTGMEEDRREEVLRQLERMVKQCNVTQKEELLALIIMYYFERMYPFSREN